jgi:hypothetical protein
MTGEIFESTRKGNEIPAIPNMPWLQAQRWPVNRERLNDTSVDVKSLAFYGGCSRLPVAYTDGFTTGFDSYFKVRSLAAVQSNGVRRFWDAFLGSRNKITHFPSVEQGIEIPEILSEAADGPCLFEKFIGTVTKRFGDEIEVTYSIGDELVSEVYQSSQFAQNDVPQLGEGVQAISLLFRRRDTDVVHPPAAARHGLAGFEKYAGGTLE